MKKAVGAVIPSGESSPKADGSSSWGSEVLLKQELQRWQPGPEPCGDSASLSGSFGSHGPMGELGSQLVVQLVV